MGIWFGDGIGFTVETSDDEIVDCSVQAADAETAYDYFFPAADGHIFNPHRFLLFDDNAYDPSISDEKWKATFNVVLHGHEPSPYSFISSQQLPDNQRMV